MRRGTAVSGADADAPRPADPQPPPPRARRHPHPLVQGQRHGARHPAARGPERRAAGADRRHAPRPQGAAKIRWFGYDGCGIVKYDRTSGARRVHRAGDARLRGEAVFVPAVGATREDDGYLLTVVFDLKQDASQLQVPDASGLDRIATVHLPRRATGGIHGSWIPDTGLDTSAG